MLRALGLSLALVLTSAPLHADARLSVLFDSLRISEVVQIMRAEGLNYAEDLNQDLLAGQGGAFWEAQVEGIYDPQRMQETVRSALESGLADEEIAAARAFFASDRGARIVSLENAARLAMQDDSVEENARARFEEKAESGEGHVLLIRAFVAANDLMERNVSGAMSANLQFYQGLVDGRMMEMSQADIAQDVWAQEPEIRAETEGWLFAYLHLAYGPLPVDDLETYLAFSRTDAGKALNAALFDGYEAMYRDISYALGRAVALSAQGNDI